MRFELLRSARPEESRQLEAQFATLPTLAIPAELWQRAIVLGQACRPIGRSVVSLDLLVAAVALHHNAVLWPWSMRTALELPDPLCATAAARNPQEPSQMGRTRREVHMQYRDNTQTLGTQFTHHHMIHPRTIHRPASIDITPILDQQGDA
ncbi:MAG: hypothetical protein NTW51_08470 [Cyanobacteria bacterium]|nr:hypothetical protein [Cyanobacteriota bacterium]